MFANETRSARKHHVTGLNAYKAQSFQVTWDPRSLEVGVQIIKLLIDLQQLHEQTKMTGEHFHLNTILLYDPMSHSKQVCFHVKNERECLCGN